MSLWGDAKYQIKKAMLVMMGPADLDDERDPQRRLEREHDAQKKGETEGKDWDRG